MSPELESALLVLVYSCVSLVSVLTIFLFTRMFSSNDRKVELSGTVKTKLDGSTEAADNYYTKAAADAQTDAAKANQKAGETALKTAETQERTEKLRLERARIEHPNSA